MLGQSLTDYVVPEENQATAQVEEVQVDPEMDFSGSDQSDFEDVFQIKELDKDEEIQEEDGIENDTQRKVFDMEDNTMPIQLKGIRDYDSSWLRELLAELYSETKTNEEIAKFET